MTSRTRKKPTGAYSDKLWRDAIRKAAFDVAEGRRGPKKIEMAARSLVDAAVAGDIAAAKEMGDRLDGKATQPVEGNLNLSLAVNDTIAEMRERARKLRAAG